MRRTQEEAEQTRREILDAALTVFSQSGYEAARLRDIAEGASVTRGAIYHHFGSKAGLYTALIDEASETSNRAIAEAVDKGGTLPEIITRILVMTLHLLEDDRRFREVMALSLFQATTSPDLQELAERRSTSAAGLVEGIQGAFGQGIAQGEFRTDLDPRTIARAFLAYQQGLALLWLSNPAAFSVKASASSLADIFLRGIVTG